MEPKQPLFLACLLALTPTLASATPPNLCDDVYLDADGVPLHDLSGTTFPRYCEFTGPDAPRWSAPVCCSFADDDARCTETDTTGGCAAEQSQMWCDHGERLADGSVVCYRPLPSTCDYIRCDPAPPTAELAVEVLPLCCGSNGECYQLSIGDDCGGHITFCDAPYTNMDGTVGCADDE